MGRALVPTPPMPDPWGSSPSLGWSVEGPRGPSGLVASPGTQASWRQARSLPAGWSWLPVLSWPIGSLPRAASVPFRTPSHACGHGQSLLPQDETRPRPAVATVPCVGPWVCAPRSGQACPYQPHCHLLVLLAEAQLRARRRGPLPGARVPKASPAPQRAVHKHLLNACLEHGHVPGHDRLSALSFLAQARRSGHTILWPVGVVWFVNHVSRILCRQGGCTQEPRVRPWCCRQWRDRAHW